MKRKKIKPEKIDGFEANDAKKIRSALRSVWRYSHAHKLVVNRCLITGGFSRCEQCKKKCPKVFVDHIKRVGDIDEGFIKRLFVSSLEMQGLCKKCHQIKTNEERRVSKRNNLNEDFW